MKLGYEHQDTHGKTFFYTIYRISFSHSYRIEKSAVQVYILPSIYYRKWEHETDLWMILQDQKHEEKWA
jgi:hypothetical protein